MIKRIVYLIVILFSVSCGSDKTANVSNDSGKEIKVSHITAQSVLSVMERGKYKEGELLIRFKTGVVRASALKTHQSTGASVKKRFAAVLNLEHVKIPIGLSVKDAIAVYMSDSNVLYAEPNYLRHAKGTIPSDPFFNLQWALRNTGQSVNWTPGADIKATDAWDISKGGDQVTVAFLDTGIDYNHPDLLGNIWINGAEDPNNGIDDDGNGKIDDWRGWNFVNNNNDPMDDEGHGTHVAGITGAVGNNNIGIAGVMWNVKLMPLKMLDANGEGTISDEIEAIDYAMAKGVKVVNSSFTGSEFSNAEFDIINSANNAGMLFVSAAGNGGDDGIGDNNDITPQYPANYKLPNIISVTATDQNDRRALFSNYGFNSVHVAAPGEDILSTFPSAIVTSGYKYETGTSMSTPIVSGLAGLLYSYYPSFNYSQIRGIILRYVDILPDLQGVIRTGGRINAYRSLSSLLPPSAFSLSINNSNMVNLAWTDHATGEDGYIIERKAGVDQYSQLVTLAANSVSYTDNSAIDGTVYTYRVKAYSLLPNPPSASNIQAESLPVEASVTTPINSPAGLNASALSGASVRLTWTDNSRAEEGYKIERKGSDDNYAQIAVTGPDLTTFTDTGLSPSTVYTYRVRAFNFTAGDSPYSNEISVTTLSGSSSSGGGGGGGCSIGSRQNTQTTALDLTMLMIPFLITVLMRRRKRDRK